MRFFLLVLVFLASLRLTLALTPLPQSIAVSASLLVTVLFVALPILALFRAAMFEWTPKIALAFVIAGVALHAGGAFISASLLKNTGAWAVVFNALKDTGLMVWCVGLGALLATLIRDKNLLVPVAIFLAGFDMFLVFNPTGPVQQFIVKRPAVAQAMTYSTPKVATTPGRVIVESLAYVGPADFLFLAMFFIALFKFKMRTAETLRWMVPVLLVYLVTVVVFGGVKLGPLSLGALPALVPIGVTVLLVNRREFSMKKDEVAATIVVTLLAIGLATFGIIRAQNNAQASPIAPSNSEPVPAAPKSPN